MKESFTPFVGAWFGQQKATLKHKHCSCLCIRNKKERNCMRRTQREKMEILVAGAGFEPAAFRL